MSAYRLHTRQHSQFSKVYAERARWRLKHTMDRHNSTREHAERLGLAVNPNLFEDDDFARTFQARVEARKRARAGILGIVGVLGAGVAAAQFNLLLESAFLENALSLNAKYVSALAASMIIAAAVISTAIVLQREG